MNDKELEQFNKEVEALSMAAYEEGKKDGENRDIVDALTGEEKSPQNRLFSKVIDLKDTTKASFLTTEELGAAEIPVRTSQWLSLYSEEMGNKGLAKMFNKEAEIILATALSKKGFLIDKATTQTKISRMGREITPEKKSFFGKSKKEEQY